MGPNNLSDSHRYVLISIAFEIDENFINFNIFSIIKDVIRLHIAIVVKLVKSI